ncbi:type II secretion system F family protein [Paenibacillus xanthanilyticus]|uniref:Type II secretion system F family protein n=1 Tax=Paenibacillus xanthanilyticus TaxID=1783531 RepID=A0ABV8K4E2_9BACL
MSIELVLLWVVLFLFLGLLLGVVIHSLSTRSVIYNRLAHRRENKLGARFVRQLRRAERPYRHVDEMLEALSLGIAPEAVFGVTALLFIAGLAFGVMVFHGVKGTLLLTGMLTALPYTLLWTMLMHRRMQTRSDFLPALELFYQCCLMNGGRHIRSALHRTVEEKRLLGPMQLVFEQLYRNLSVRGDDEASLRIFASSLGHIWADYFIQIVRAGLAEGYPITDSLKDLIGDMRKARRANQQERNKLLEIRMANFTPVLFLALFMYINFRYNPDNAYLYYVSDPKGRDLILNAVVLMFVSFLMGLWLSRKKL